MEKRRVMGYEAKLRRARTSLRGILLKHVPFGSICALMSVCIQMTISGNDRTFVIDHENKRFLKDGQPFRYVAGEMHYFRVPRAYWKDRLHRIKMAGLNAVSFYIEWSGHEPEPGQYNFEDMYDLDAFLKEVKEQDLLAIVRPGPNISGDRDNGGLPYWLHIEQPNMKYRVLDSEFRHHLDRWIIKLCTVLSPYTYNKAGPVIAVQVEHLYGVYGACDHLYMEHLLTMLEVRLGREMVFFRGDPATKSYYDCDKVREILVTAYMAPTAIPAVVAATVAAAQVEPGPLVISEYYTGNTDCWGWPHKVVPPQTVLQTFKTLMAMNASVSLYMFHGGTNFGFTAGGREKRPMVTSYDYEAPLSEAGDPNALYYDIRRAISTHLQVPKDDPPGPSRKMEIGPIPLDKYVSLDEVMAHFRGQKWLKRKESAEPLSFENLGQAFGFVLYSTTVTFATAAKALLQLEGLSDRAYVYGKGGEVSVFYSFAVSGQVVKIQDYVPAGINQTLSILVENMGREAHSQTFANPKGFKSAKLNYVLLKNWAVEAVPLATAEDINRVQQLLQKKDKGGVPGFFHGVFQLPEGQQPLDTFLDPTNWTKGVAFVNGVNLGRYWPVTGPQITLYVPGPFLKPHPEENSVMLFETQGAPPRDRTVRFVDKPRVNVTVLYPKP
ncbi:beta-galactosidase-like isoform X2 [Dermacentor andersoni]|uniref:beta-galactosidase-like isoform X2 n=1 Tax=Dermacentor andersoni TaxID=34620 RepID=UPI00241726FF|nr:beta-galactosidase-like isoform X2 [Dermacentor andersoni]